MRNSVQAINKQVSESVLQVFFYHHKHTDLKISVRSPLPRMHVGGLVAQAGLELELSSWG